MSSSHHDDIIASGPSINTHILILIEDEIFFSNIFGILIELKIQNADFLIIIKPSILRDHLNLFEEFSLLNFVINPCQIHATYMISQWGSPNKKAGQKNWLMHTGMFKASKILMVPHGLEIKNAALRFTWTNKISTLIKKPYSEYQNITYYFDSEFHYQRYLDVPYFDPIVLKNPTFHSKHTQKIKEFMKSHGPKFSEPIMFCPKISHVGKDCFLSILSKAAETAALVRLHPREIVAQTNLAKQFKLRNISDFKPIHLFNAEKIYDYGTSMSAFACLLGINCTLENKTGVDLIFDWSGWSAFKHKSENFCQFNVKIK